MKIRLVVPLILAVSMIFAFEARAYHGTEAENAPLPVRECFNDATAHNEIMIARLAGLTLEEQRLDNDFAHRIVVFYAKQNGLTLDGKLSARLDALTVEIYSIDEADLQNREFMQAWATKKFDECVAKIPLEDSEPESESLNRMMPET